MYELTIYSHQPEGRDLKHITFSGFISYEEAFQEMGKQFRINDKYKVAGFNIENTETREYTKWIQEG